MARKPSFKTGYPAIATPRLEPKDAGLRAAIDSIRERFVNLEAQVLFLAQLADASTSGETIASIQGNLATLAQSINVLVAQLAAMVGTEPPDNDGQQSALLAEVAELKKSVNDLAVTPPSNLAARFDELVKRVDGNITLLEAKEAESAQTTQTLLHQAGSRAIIDKFSATNRTGGTVTLQVNIVASGGSAGNTNIILFARGIASGETYNCPELVGHTLQPGDFISWIAGAANSIVVRISGREVTS
jgi:hypothetical protein